MSALDMNYDPRSLRYSQEEGWQMNRVYRKS